MMYGEEGLKLGTQLEMANGWRHDAILGLGLRVLEHN